MVWLVASMEAQLCQDLIEFVRAEAHRFLMMPDHPDCRCGEERKAAPVSMDRHMCRPGQRFRLILAKIENAEAPKEGSS